jgi:hypothetical protein
MSEDNSNQSPNIVSFQVREDGQAVVLCVHCGEEKLVDVAKVPRKALGKPLTVKCTCGRTTRGRIDLRRYPRKPVKLPGTFRSLKRDWFQGEIEVRDLSLGGMAFIYKDLPELEMDERIEITFTLDDPRHSRVRRIGKVVTIRDHLHGVHFDEAQSGDRSLGFYLMP